ncbi:MAG TPA: hypothetical protein PKE55_10745 [Kiritimatiellia bacterium]|nr:hypothetical protein [Kiritimatiellia bacterium]
MKVELAGHVADFDEAGGFEGIDGTKLFEVVGEGDANFEDVGVLKEADEGGQIVKLEELEDVGGGPATKLEEGGRIGDAFVEGRSGFGVEAEQGFAVEGVEGVE